MSTADVSRHTSAWRYILPASGARGFFAYFVLLILTTLGTLTFLALSYTNTVIEARFLESLKRVQERSVTAMSSEVQRTLRQVSTDVILMRESVEHSFTDDISMDELGAVLLDFAATNPAYDQLRYLNADGLEVLRVNNGPDAPYLVRDDALQDKSDAGYFAAASSLTREAILITPMDANREQGVIQYPIKAVMRVAAPVFEADGKRAGIVIINYLANELLSKLASVGNTAAGEALVISQRGRNALDAFQARDVSTVAIESAPPAAFAERFSEAWAAMQSLDSGPVSDGLGGLVTFARLAPSQLQSPADFISPIRWEMPLDQNGDFVSAWYLGQHLTADRIESTLNIGRSQSGASFWAFVCLLVAIAWMLALRIASLRLVAREMREAAGRDDLTGLLSRGEFDRRLESALAHAKRYDRPLALLYLDLNDFKTVNDTLGHAAGDKVLRHAAAVLKEAIRRSDIIGRLGGDEFAIVLTELRSADDILTITSHLRGKLAKPVSVEGRLVSVGGSIGAASYPEDGDSSESLTQAADAAMYQDKKAKNRA
ncbi:MAG: hypothetical protein Cons2KO_32060 [Congregibacter sp.]